MKLSFLLYGLLLLALIGGMCLPLFPIEVEQETFDTVCGMNAVAFDECLSSDGFSVGSGSAILIDAESGSVLYSKNADMQRGMASTTKVMTALVVLETLSLEDVVEITPEMTGVEGSSLYLTVGERLSVEELLYGLMLESGNDAAVALAIACDGSVEKFAERMNERAASLGLTHTHFANPHGLSAAGHYTTARELALITAEAMKNDSFRTIVSTYQKQIPYQNHPQARYLTNHNPLLKKYDGMIGVKTGWTTADGKCFVTAAQRDGLTLIAVSLGDTNISVTHKALLDHGFETFSAIPLKVNAPLTIPLVGGTQDFLPLQAESELTVCLPKGETVQTRLELPPFLYAGTEKGQTVGRAVFYWNDTEIGSVLLQTASEAPVKRISFWEKLFH